MNPGGNYFHVKSPHGTWDVIISLYPADYLRASELVGHALLQIPVPESQRRFRWYLFEDGRRIEDDEQLHSDRERTFNLIMDMGSVENATVVPVEKQP